MANTRNSRKKPSGPSAASNPAAATTARKAASKRNSKEGNQVSNDENYPQDDSNADVPHNTDNAGEPLLDEGNARRGSGVGLRELMEKYTEMQGGRQLPWQL
jgi:hypothetical protein